MLSLLLLNIDKIETLKENTFSKINSKVFFNFHCQVKSQSIMLSKINLRVDRIVKIINISKNKEFEKARNFYQEIVSSLQI